MKTIGVIGEGSDSFPIVEEFEAKKREIRCAVYFKLLKLTISYDHVTDISPWYDIKERAVPYPIPHKTIEIVNDSEYGHEWCSQTSCKFAKFSSIWRATFLSWERANEESSR